jgi:hypothetical protein
VTGSIAGSKVLIRGVCGGVVFGPDFVGSCAQVVC